MRDVFGISLDDRRTVQVRHKPDLLSGRLRPDLFVGPANLRGSVRRVIVFLGFHADRKRAYHLARAHTIEGCPVVVGWVHVVIPDGCFDAQREVTGINDVPE